MEELIDGIYREKIGMSNCFILDKADGLYLLDTGYDGSGKKVTSFVKEIAKNTDKGLKAVLVSHHHLDHASGLWKLEKEFNVPIFAHSHDISVILRETTPPPGEGIMGHLFSWFLKLSRYHPPKIVLAAEDQVFPFSIVHLPGHTDGHVAIHDRETKTVLCADLFTVGKDRLKLPPRFFNQSMKQHLRSIRQLKEMIEKKELNVKNVVPSHGRAYLKDAESRLLEKIADLLERHGV